MCQGQFNHFYGTVSSKIIIRKRSKRQKRKQLERSRRDAKIKKLKKHPLCVSKGFLEHVRQQGWEDDMADAAARVMHYYFMHIKKINERGWLPIPHQVFRGMFGKKYKKTVNRLIESGFLQYNRNKNYFKGSYCREYMICDELREDCVSASYQLKTKKLQKTYLAQKEYWKRKRVKEKQEIVAKTVESAFSDNLKTSHYRLVLEGHITEEQYQTILKLATNALSLKLSINKKEVHKIALARYSRKNDNEKTNYEFDAYLQRLLGQADGTEPRISVDRNARYYTPWTNLPREYCP